MPRALVVICAVALAVRVAVIAATPGFEPVFDALDYSRHAESIAAGEGYPESVITAAREEPSAFRPPAYPYALGALFALTGDSWTAARLLDALLGVAAVALTFVLGRRLFGERAGLAAAALTAVFPPLVFLSASLTVESLFIPLLLGAVLALLVFRDGGELRWAALAGVLIGAASLTRFNGLALLLPALLAVLAAPRARLAGAAAIGACVLLVMAPWTVRSSSAFDAFVPLGTQGGYALAGTYNSVAEADPDQRGAWRLPNVAPELRPLFVRADLDERELDSELRERARDFIEEHRGYPLAVLASNSWRLVNPLAYEQAANLSYDGMGVPSGWRRVLDWSWLALLAAALAGMVAIARGRAARPPAFIWLVPLVIVASITWIAAEPRYRTAVDPFAALAAGALAAGWRPLTAARGGPRAAPTSPPSPAA